MKEKKKQSKRKVLIRHLIDTLKKPLTYGYIFIAVVLVVATFTVYWTETQTESGIETMFDSVWFTLVAIVAGYFDYCVESVPGRMAALMLLILGMLLLSAVTGKVASIFMDIQMKKDKGLKKLRSMKGHFLLCGWRPGFDKILDAVLSSNPDIEVEMIVLINDAAEHIAQIRSLARFKEINYISGDFSDEATLAKARIEDAERALIISDSSQNYSQLEKDSRTVLAVLTMKNMNPSLYIAAEIADAKFENHLHMAHCDEIILTSDYEYSLLATASSGMGYSNVIRELIGDDADSGIVIEDISSSFYGREYHEYKVSHHHSGVLVGLLLNTGNFYQRRKDALREAQKNPDVKKIVDNLKKVKLLKSNEPLFAPSDDYIILPNTKAIFVKGKKKAE